MSLITNLGDVIERNAKSLSDEVFVSENGRDVTFAAFSERVRRLGSALHRNGARKQDRIAILSTNRGEYAETYGVAESCGYIAVLINFRLAGPEIEWILRDCRPTVLIFEARYEELVERLRPELPSVSQFVCIGGEAPAWATEFEQLITSGFSEGPPFRSNDDDYVNIMYTSGTTGRPKGVLTKHRQPISLGLTQGFEHGSAIGTSALVILPMFHLGARSLYLSQMLRGGRIVIQNGFDPENALAAIEHHGIQILGLVPTMIQAMLDFPKFESYDVSSLRSIITFGAAAPVSLLRRAITAFGPVFLNGYGQTEGGNTILRRRYFKLDGDERDMLRLASVGQPLMHTEVRIVDDTGSPVPAGVDGEICLRGDQVMEGYWNNHNATIEALRDGWLFTGDVGHVGEENFLYMVDRKKDMIISGGENVYSSEVESALLLHPAIREAAVIGAPDAQWGELVMAIVVLKPESEIDDGELSAFVKTRIAAYKCPKKVIVVEALPLGPTGKIDKLALRSRFASGTLMTIRAV